jgi:hypothetical protein
MRRHEEDDLGVACLYLAQLSASRGELQNLTLQPWQLKRFRLVREDRPVQQAFVRLFNEKSSSFKTLIQIQSDGTWMLGWPERPPLSGERA